MEDTQLLKGILEGCILSIIEKGETYGYDILSKLDENGFENILEGTLYPVLTRLLKKDLIACHIGKSPMGPPRKYYSITTKGARWLTSFKDNYIRITTNANILLFEEYPV